MPAATEADGTAPLVLSDWDALADAHSLGIGGCSGNCPTGNSGGAGVADGEPTVATGDLERPFHVGEHIAQATPAPDLFSYPHSLEQIAEELGLSVGRVSTIIDKAQKRARIMLERRGYGLEDCFDNRIAQDVLYTTRRPGAKIRSE